jgi:hypothetical protein
MGEKRVACVVDQLNNDKAVLKVSALNQLLRTVKVFVCLTYIKTCSLPLLFTINPTFYCRRIMRQDTVLSIVIWLWVGWSVV